MGNATPADSNNLERFLTTIYVDPEARARFVASPEAEASRAGLSEKQCLKLKEIDFIGLKLASGSFARKRASKRAKSAASNSGEWLRILKSLSPQEWLSRVFRHTAMSPVNRKAPVIEK